ncbi:MAG: hypothetical protein VB098_04720 [Petrimonas sp.]|nr:hypothetical protein [Petrimonas sp.]MEA4979180.1 hypothetical protein [Petrimonas sp.]
MKQKTLFTTIAVIFSFLAFSGCTGNSQKGTLTVDNILSNPGEYVGKPITVEGLATHVCAKSGMKLFLQGSTDAQSIRAESNSTLGKFNEECVNNKVVVKGTLVEERITEADLQKMEEEITEGTNVTHGEGGEGCETEQKTEGLAVGSSEMGRVNDFRTRIAERKASEGKDYLSFYHIAADSYHIVKDNAKR